MSNLKDVLANAKEGDFIVFRVGPMGVPCQADAWINSANDAICSRSFSEARRLLEHVPVTDAELWLARDKGGRVDLHQSKPELNGIGQFITKSGSYEVGVPIVSPLHCARLIVCQPEDCTPKPTRFGVEKIRETWCVTDRERPDVVFTCGDSERAASAASRFSGGFSSAYWTPRAEVEHPPLDWVNRGCLWIAERDGISASVRERTHFGDCMWSASDAEGKFVRSGTTKTLEAAQAAAEAAIRGAT